MPARKVNNPFISPDYKTAEPVDHRINSGSILFAILQFFNLKEEPVPEIEVTPGVCCCALLKMVDKISDISCIHQG